MHQHRWFIFVVFIMATCSSADSIAVSRSILNHPKTYLVRRAPYSLLDAIDGDLSKSVWESVPFSEAFADITGEGDTNSSSSDYEPAKTQFKALYDDTHLYIGAVIHPNPDFGTIAQFTHRNDPIYQLDSDFEVFIDPTGSTHYYKELEINAINTVWNLMLNKPYRDGGVEHSGRVARPGETLYYEVFGQRTAVRVLEGALNDASQGALWSVELALAFQDITAYTSAPVPPSQGQYWRINFSRVELQGAVNWTWQRQEHWDPESGSYVGKVDMHLPDSWGYIVFAGDFENQISINDKASSWQDPLWPARVAIMSIYYAQALCKDQTGVYASSLQELNVDWNALEVVESVDMQRTEMGYSAVATYLDNEIRIREDRFMTVTSLSLPSGDSSETS